MVSLAGIVLVFCLLALLPQKAAAQTPSPLAEWQYSAGVPLRAMFENPIPKWEASFGPAVQYQPRYEGSNSYEVQPGLALDIRYRDLAFLSTGEGLGINILHSKTYRVGVALAYDLGRDHNDVNNLRGIGNIATAPEAKFFAEYLLFPVVLRIDVRRGFGGNNGWIGDLGAYMPVYGTKKFFLFAGPTVSYADSTYMRNNFGVNFTQSQTSHLRQFDPGAGFKDVGFGLSATWILSKHWLVTGDTAIERLVGAAAESPFSNNTNAYVLDTSVEYQF